MMPSTFTPARAYEYWLYRADDEGLDRWNGYAGWYDVARRWAEKLAEEHGVSLSTVAAVIAALSPQARWSQQQKMTGPWLQLMLQHPEIKPEKLAKEAPYPTFLPNRAKAIGILRGDLDPEDTLGPKTKAFWKAIMGDPDAIVIDTWMQRAAGWEEHRLTPSRYDALCDALKAACAAYGWRGAYADAQATIWETVRKEWHHDED